jgi:L-ascorbate metabolism protein UlaG (beta-lactamase superfamily)
MIKYTYYGHSSFHISYEGSQSLFDPFITGNPLMKDFDIDSIKAEFIFISHGHGDHLADALRIAQNNDAVIVSAHEVCQWFGKQGYSKVHGMNMGGSWNFGNFKVKCVSALHSSCMPDGTYGGNPLGFVVHCGEKSFYYAGDTALTLDMQLIPKYWARLDFAVLPIGGNFTMDMNDALIASDLLACNTVVGVHYDTFEPIKINHEEAFRIFHAKDKTLLLPAPGTHLDF